MEDNSIRLNKYLSEQGICSRRAADAAIEAGQVFVDGVVAVMGQKVTGTEDIVFKDKPVSKAKQQAVFLAFNKPVGIVCTSEKKEKNNIIDYINYPTRIYNVGRLDKDSRGLILLTNQGDLVNKLMRASNYHEKEYIVRVDKSISKDFIQKMSEGIYLEELDATTRPCKVKKLDEFTFSIILTQGLNRQIRRMCDALGYRVKDLRRIRIMNIEIGNLQEGQYRELTAEEIKILNKSLEGSRN